VHKNFTITFEEKSRKKPYKFIEGHKNGAHSEPDRMDVQMRKEGLCNLYKIENAFSGTVVDKSHAL